MFDHESLGRLFALWLFVIVVVAGFFGWALIEFIIWLSKNVSDWLPLG